MNTAQVSATQFLEEEFPGRFGPEAAKYLTEGEHERMSAEKASLSGLTLEFASRQVRALVRDQISTNVTVAGDTGLPNERGTLVFMERDQVEFRPHLAVAAA